MSPRMIFSSDFIFQWWSGSGTGCRRVDWQDLGGGLRSIFTELNVERFSAICWRLGRYGQSGETRITWFFRPPSIPHWLLCICQRCLCLLCQPSRQRPWLPGKFLCCFRRQRLHIQCRQQSLHYIGRRWGSKWLIAWTLSLINPWRGADSTIMILASVHTDFIGALVRDSFYLLYLSIYPG